MLEIIDVERDYVHSLNAIIKVFYKPAITQQLLSEKEAALLFANSMKILEVHEAQLQKLLLRFETWNYSSGISDLFEGLFLNIGEYSIFIANYTHASAFLKEKESDKAFHQFLMKAHLSPECNGLDLISLLIQPVQRLPRYELLLKEYLKYLDSSHADYKATHRLVVNLERLLRRINDSSKTIDKIDELLKRVKGSDSVDCCDYIMEAKFVERQKWSCEIYAFLFRNVIIYAKYNHPSAIKKLLSINMYQFQLRSAIYLLEMQDICEVDKEGYENSFALKTKQGVFLLQSKTKKQRDEWYLQLSSLITTGRPLSEQSPVLPLRE